MTKFKFKLETVLKVKIRLEEQRNQELKRAEIQLQQAIQTLELRRAEFNAALKQSQASLTAKFDLSLANNYQRFLAWLNKLIQQDSELVLYCEQNVVKARERLTEAAKEKQVLEKLKEKAYQEYLAEELNVEIKFLDELGTNRFARFDSSDDGGS